MADEQGVADLKDAVSRMWAQGDTYCDKGVHLADMLNSTTSNPSSYIAENVHSVVVFTDGKRDNGDIPNDRANATLETTYNFKHHDISVYSVGVYRNGDATDSEINFLSRVSSNYPNVRTWNESATPDSDKYSFKAENPDQLKEIFAHIAEETSGANVKWDETTVVQDVISEYFKIPEGVAATDIAVKTANCTGVDGVGKLIFDTPVASGLHATFYEGDRTKVRVTGFNFSGNWCGNRSATGSEYDGMKLVIEIPIEAKPGAQPGIHATNASGSTIFPNGDENNPADPFPTPLFYTKGETWVEAVTSAPEGWSLDNIDSAEDLAWLISYVCGYNGVEEHPDAVATLTADVDMSANIWVPIGGWGYCKNLRTAGGSDFHDSYPTNTDGFTGTFDGQGHVIRGMKSIDPITMPQGGMFGYVNGGTVMNTFVVGANFAAVVGDPENDPKLCTGTEGHFGIIADTLCNGGTIFNCEAEGIIMTYALADNMYSDPTYGELYEDPERSYLGGLVGLVGRDKAGNTSPATVHSCISVASLLGYHMAGCVNEIEANSEMKNCYSYTLFHSWMPTVTSSLGGLVATNAGKVQNCYLRDRADANVFVNGYFEEQPFSGTYKAVQAAGQGTKGDWHKGLLIGLNGGSATGIYVPKEWKDCPAKDTDNMGVCFVGYGNDSNEAQGVGWFSDAVTPYYYKHNDTRVTMLASKEASSRLLPTLNAWLATTDGEGCTPWMRTTAAGINDDYPVLKIEGLESVASDDHVVLFYGDVNEMMSSRGLMTTGKGDDVVCLYENTDLSATNGSTTLYINEDVAVTQSATGDVEAYVGITLDNSAGAGGVNSDHGFDADAIDWHMFATSLSNAPVGINYNNDATPWPFSYGHPEGMPYYSFYGEGDRDGYFPSRSFGTDGTGGTDYYREWDFYSWSEKDQHYINFKRNSASHWTEGYDLGGTLHSNISYNNETTLVPGKGYMLAAATETFLQSHGKLNKGDVENETVTYTETPFCVGYNLIGNPYQSYLDFDEFASENDINTYVILDEDAGGYQTYTATETSRDGLRYINMHQGFFVKVDEGVSSVTFTEKMRSNDNTAGSAFRGGEDKPYPFLKLTMTEGSGVRDYATVEFDRPQLGGGEKLMDLRVGDAQIYLHHGGTSYSTLFATSDIDEVALRFSTVSDGTYTLSWELSEGDFGEMYLIDNIAGQKVDMLSRGEYKFSGLASDYASRFRVVFSLDGSEGADAEAEPSETFAFQMGGSLVVNGTGAFQMFDVTGRLVGTAELTDVQNTLPMPQTQGLYVIRLANAGGVKVQKIVVR